MTADKKESAPAPSLSLLQRLEAGAFLGIMGFFRILGLDAASAVGGFAARLVGPLTGEQKIAMRNLRAAFPEKSEAELKTITRRMWDNLGRTFAEYPHLSRFRCYEPGGRVEVVGEDAVVAQHAEKPGALLVSGHFGNWELMPMACHQKGLPGGVIYRAANNPIVDNWIVTQRKKYVMPVQVPKKDREASRAILRILKQRGYLPMLIDQRLGDGGIPVPFFGRDAMTTPAAAVLAIKYDYPVFMAHCERLGGAHFRIVVSDRLQFERSGDEMIDIYNALIKMNEYLEARIRERPWEWLWAHNRWKPGINAMPVPEGFGANPAPA